MTVAELIAKLQPMDPTRIVILQKDAEGNGYSPLEGVEDNAAYRADATWCGDVKPQSLSVDDRNNGYSDEDLARPGAVPCVVLFPVN